MDRDTTNSMDLRQLRYFLAVADAGGFSKGAERVHVAQPALSAHVSKLEEELGTALFVRSSKGVALTHAGSVLVGHATDILRRVRNAQDAVRHASDEVHGEVSLGLPTTVSTVLALPLVQQVRSAWPNVSLRVLEGHSGWLQEWLVSGRLDAAVLFGVASSKGMRVTPLLDEDLYLISAAGAAGEPASDTVEMRDLADYPLTLPAQGHGLRTTIDRAAAMAGVSLQITIEMDSFASNKKLVGSGLAHTILSRAAVDEEVKRGELMARRIVNPAVTRSVVYAMREERMVGQAHIKVAEALRAQIIALVESGAWPARLRL